MNFIFELAPPTPTLLCNVPDWALNGSDAYNIQTIINSILASYQHFGKKLRRVLRNDNLPFIIP